MDQDISEQIDSFLKEAHAVEPMEADRWLLASVLQKAIRRGDEAVALKAGKGLWLADRQNFWRRLHTTAFEDIGIADLDAITICLKVTLARSWRDKAWDVAAGLHLIRLLCAAPKCRIADELYLLIERGCQHSKDRERIGRMPEVDLMEVVSGNDTICRKALALWTLAGTERLPSDHLMKRKGSKETIASLYQDIDAPDDLKTACLGLLYRTQWPLCLFTPLIAQEMKDEKPVVSRNTLRPPILTDGIPHYGADQYTRLGKSCIRLWMAEVPKLKRFSTAQVGMALFYLEGGMTDTTLRSPILNEISEASELAMMCSLGLCEPEYMALRGIMTHSLDILDHIRAVQIERYMQDFKGGLL